MIRVGIILAGSVLLVVGYQSVVYGFTAGDINQDGVVNVQDFTLFSQAFGTTSSSADFNGDGVVNLLDFTILSNNFGMVKPTPTVMSTPTIPPTLSPTPSPIPPSAVYRAFNDSSYWNTPMPVDAPIDPNSDTYIADAKNPCRSTAFLKLSGAPGHWNGDDWAYPIYWASITDPWYHIEASASYSPVIDTRIPLGATPQAGSDGGIIIYDLAADQVVEMWQAEYDAAGNTWTASSNKRYILSSNGLDFRADGSDNQLNDGHRGVATPIRAIRLDEVASGHIGRRLECFWHDTGEQHYWPMVGHEAGKGGITPEGLVLRLKPSVNLDGKSLSMAEKVIARAMQEFGCIIGDNEGGIGNSLKLERGQVQWESLDPDMWYTGLNVLTWDEFEFILGGYDPLSGNTY